MTGQGPRVAIVTGGSGGLGAAFGLSGGRAVY
jgi:NAD(P)-dependent dehydrogenase (short-subunit alcohol dehydrogenase family)